MSHPPAMVGHEENTQSSCRQKKGSAKSKKQSFKVARDRLTKKWTVVKKGQQLKDAIEMAFLLEALGCCLMLLLSLFHSCSISLPEYGDVHGSNLTVLLG
jgi:hypothetical protein